jgi:hypothetical protein
MSKDFALVEDGTCGIYRTVTEGAHATTRTAVGLCAEGAMFEGLDSKTSVVLTVTAGGAEITRIDTLLAAIVFRPGSGDVPA